MKGPCVVHIITLPLPSREDWLTSTQIVSRLGLRAKAPSRLLLPLSSSCVPRQSVSELFKNSLYPSLTHSLKSASPELHCNSHAPPRCKGPGRRQQLVSIPPAANARLVSRKPRRNHDTSVSTISRLKKQIHSLRIRIL